MSSRTAERSFRGFPPKDVGDHVGGLTIAGLEEVRVDVQRRRGVGVSESAAHRSDGHARREELCRVEVPQVMQPDAAETDSVAQPAGSRR